MTKHYKEDRFCYWAISVFLPIAFWYVYVLLALVDWKEFKYCFRNDLKGIIRPARKYLMIRSYRFKRLRPRAV